MKLTSEDFEIIEEIKEGPTVRVGLLVKDLKNKSDAHTYLFNVSSPKSLFDVTKKELEASNFNWENVIREKVNKLKENLNDYCRGFVKRVDNHYTIVNTTILSM